MSKFKMKCARCRRTFGADSPKAKYCSDAHKQADYNDRKAERERHSRQAAAARPKAEPRNVQSSNQILQVEESNERHDWQPTPAQISLMRVENNWKLYPILFADGKQMKTPDGHLMWKIGNPGNRYGKSIAFDPPGLK